MTNKEKLAQALKNGECIDAEGDSLFIEKAKGGPEPLGILLSDVGVDHFGNVYLKGRYIGAKANIELIEAIFNNPAPEAIALSGRGENAKNPDMNQASEYSETLEAFRSAEADLAHCSYSNPNPNGAEAQGTISVRKDGSLIFAPKSDPAQAAEIQNAADHIDADVDGRAFCEGKPASFENEAAIEAAIAKATAAVSSKLIGIAFLDPRDDYWKKLGALSNGLAFYERLAVRLNEAKEALFGPKEPKKQ